MTFPPPSWSRAQADRQAPAWPQDIGPLSEALCTTPGDRPSAFGFALGWAICTSASLIVICESDPDALEDGRPAAEGLAQFAAPLERVVCVRPRTRADALWSAEQALDVPAAFVIVSIGRALTLTASRRLLLRSRESGSRCMLLRCGTGAPSAAWTRWRIRSLSSAGPERLTGPPVLEARLEKCRTGRAPRSWVIGWKADEAAFRVIEHQMDRRLADAATCGASAFLRDGGGALQAARPL